MATKTGIALEIEWHTSVKDNLPGQSQVLPEVLPVAGTEHPRCNASHRYLPISWLTDRRAAGSSGPTIVKRVIVVKRRRQTHTLSTSFSASSRE